jgi:glycosyltransferase involved in cell wall biosynthesis
VTTGPAGRGEVAVLALLERYLPGYKAGGPLRTVQNMVEQMGPPFRFRILTRDRDLGDARPYPGIVPGAWQPVGRGEAMYLPPRQVGLRGLRRAMRGTAYDVLYLNSLFSAPMSIAPLLLRRLRAVPVTPVVLAPRGELHPGALSVGGWGGWLPRRLAERLPPPKYLKKRLYIALSGAAGLYRGVTWQASSEHEAAEIRRRMGRRAAVVVAPDLVAAPAPCAVLRAPKRAGVVRAMFLSRIDPKKNLAYAIALLGGVRGRVELGIYGPVGDPDYWARCRALFEALPPHVEVRYHGPVQSDRVAALMRSYDVFLLPTLGENFGHVVVEALVQGCPALISDQTPWRGLEAAHAGWDLPLDRPAAFVAALQRVSDMGPDEHARWSAGAAALGRRRSADETALRLNRELFLRTAGSLADARRERGPRPPARPRAQGLLAAPGLSRGGGRG